MDAIECALDGVAGGAGAVAADAEEDHDHHDEADGGAHAQRPLDAEHVRRGVHLLRTADRGPTQGRECLHQNHQHGGTDRAGNLTDRVRDGRAGTHLFGLKAVERPCGDRHQHESHADLTDELPYRHPPDPRGHGNQTHHDRAEQQSDRADQRHRTRAETVKRLTAEELRDALAERAGQHHQAADRGGIASAILNVERHDHHDRTEREERQRGGDGADGEALVFQHAQVEQRRLLGRVGRLPASAVDLPQHEPDDADHTDKHGEPHHRMRERIRFDVREAEHESAEAENRQADGEEVGFGGRVARAEITQAENRQKQ